MAKKTDYEYELGDRIQFVDNPNIQGTVIGRSEYINRKPLYQLRYADGTDSVVEAWWDEEAIEEAVEAKVEMADEDDDDKPAKKTSKRSKDEDDDDGDKPAKKSSKKSRDDDDDDD